MGVGLVFCNVLIAASWFGVLVREEHSELVCSYAGWDYTFFIPFASLRQRQIIINHTVCEITVLRCLTLTAAMCFFLALLSCRSAQTHPVVVMLVSDSETAVVGAAEHCKYKHLFFMFKNCPASVSMSF